MLSRTGRCKYGRSCRYVHPDSRNQNSNLNGPTFSKDNVNFSSEKHREVFTFLGEVKDILKTLKDFTQQHVAQMASYPNQHFIPVANQGHQFWGVGQ